MTEKDAYIDIARAYSQSSDHLINANSLNSEVIGFNTYHAFESSGGAFNSHHNHIIPSGHQAKLNLFVTNSTRHYVPNNRAIASIAMQLNSLRNRMLYPEKIGTHYKPPKEQINMVQAKRLHRRVKGIVEQVENII